jgi:hypothetical protein
MPNGINECVLMNVRNHRMLMYATRKDIKNPMRRGMRFADVMLLLDLRISSVAAAAMVGTASKKENSTVVLLGSPNN